MAYCSALRTRRSVPSRETGLMPIDEVFGKRILVTPSLVCRYWIRSLACSDSAMYSMPA
ncbi:Uncharacterised protein [Bordetella pertussis]|nr:Uncharacterised protein [Bordetella pertussis]CFO79978.1 Uncharacterised protein [Bordetella pertussis]CPM53922.1 Uncharacterised protein [Bordetella pertussis]CPO11638.1 Uncharacterised protein [Bordetella pertussis]CPO86721.1 Uncharacterised protein [Bordetella pertussis]